MNEYIEISTLLLGSENIAIRNLSEAGRTLLVEVESTKSSAICPKCNRESWVVHSSYSRYPSDLSWATWFVVLKVQVRRYVCRNRECEKRTFAEPFPDILLPYARQTMRARNVQQQIALEVNARTAERLLTAQGLGVSDTTVNRIIRALPDPQAISAPTIIGIDDWAKKKRHSYGTIIVDHKTERVIDLLEDREDKTVEEWMEAHPTVEIVTRDRADCYANGVEAGNSAVTQVADRFHLLQNAADMVKRLFSAHPRLLPACEINVGVTASHAEPVPEAIEEENATNDELGETTPASEDGEVELTYAEERFLRVKQLQAEGVSHRAIAKQVHIHRRTVHRYCRAESYDQVKRRHRSRNTDTYLPYLKQRWEAGETNRILLHAELQQIGFKGSVTAVYRATNDWPTNGVSLPKRRSVRLSPREATWLLLLDEDQLSDLQQSKRSQLLQHDDDISLIQSTTLDFINAVRSHDLVKLHDWMREATASKFKQVRNFAASIEADFECIRNALKYPFSNGRTEGHVNRLKLIKRMMYGRANFDLLRKRVLLQGHPAFT